MQTKLLVLVAVVGLARAVHADPFVSKACSISVEPAAGWRLGAAKDSLVARDPGKEAVVMVVCIARSDIDSVAGGLDKRLAEHVRNVHAQPAKTFTINGLTGIVVDGAGENARTGKPTALSVVIMKAPHNHALLILAATDADKAGAHAPEMLAMVQSLRPLAPR